MIEKDYKYLRFVPFSEILQWDVKRYLEKKIISEYQLASLSSLVTKYKKQIDLCNETKYKRIKVRLYGKGTELRDVTLGKDIKTKQQYIVKTGQLIFSKIDARNGAFAIVPDSLNGGIITNSFSVYDINSDKINGEYLTLILSSSYFRNICEQSSSGTTGRRNISDETFENISIPLPSLPEQDQLVSAYNAKIAQAEQLDKQASDMEKGIEDYLMQELGINETKTYTADFKQQVDVVKEPQIEYCIRNPKVYDEETTCHFGDEIKKEYAFLKFVSFKDIEEWGVDLILRNKKRISSKYPTKRIKEICNLGSGGTPSRSFSQYYTGSIPWAKTGEVINEEIIKTEEHISEEAIENSSARIYPQGSIIIAMYGQGDTRGRTAKLGIDAATNQACAVLYSIKNGIITTDYLWYYLQGRYNDLRSLASGNNQPNLNAGKINNYDVIIPPLEIQNEIVAHISKQKEQIKTLKQQAEQLRKEALEEFENEIFE